MDAEPLGYDELEILEALSKEGCPVCSILADSDQRYFSWLLFTLLGNRLQRDNFEQGFGLCLAHFRSALALNPEPWPVDFLCQAQKTKLGLIQWETEEYSRKSAWGARPEPKGMEQGASLRALRRFSGCLKVSRQHEKTDELAD